MTTKLNLYGLVLVVVLVLVLVRVLAQREAPPTALVCLGTLLHIPDPAARNRTLPTFPGWSGPVPRGGASPPSS